MTAARSTSSSRAKRIRDWLPGDGRRSVVGCDGVELGEEIPGRSVSHQAIGARPRDPGLGGCARDVAVVASQRFGEPQTVVLVASPDAWPCRAGFVAGRQVVD